MIIIITTIIIATLCAIYCKQTTTSRNEANVIFERDDRQPTLLVTDDCFTEENMHEMQTAILQT